jgi:hypothetical protein
MRSFSVCVGVFVSLLLGSQVIAKVHEIKGADVSVSVDDATGEYKITREKPQQSWAGSVGAAVKRVMQGEGRDGDAAFKTIEFDFANEGMSATIRAYTTQPIVLIEWKTENALAKPPAEFPNFTSIPSNLHILSYTNRTFSRPEFNAEQDTGSPYVLFDDQANTTIISPAANFMTASLHGDVKTSVSSGFVPQLANLSAGFTHRTMIVFDSGINRAYETWGNAMLALLDAKRPANDADIGLKLFGYWTDNRATYYYNYDANKGYAGTLLAVVDEIKKLGLPIGYLQLDSWWYQKTSTGPDGKEGGAKKNDKLPEGSWNKYGGLLSWTAHPDLFPNGLAAFQKQVGLPLVAHNRWIDLKSPERDQYQVSGIGSVDPKWWDKTAEYCKENGIITYEQDWLDRIYKYSPEFQSTPDKAEAFMDNMARAMRERGVTMQYCMTLPRHYLQGAKYENLTSVRVSDDGFGRSRWSDYLYVSTLAGALKEWPWVDVFMSKQTPNIIQATLTAGMVGVGDAMGDFSEENIFCVARPDGVIVKPDRPITPTDASIIAEASGKQDAMVAATCSQHGDRKTAYVFAFPRAKDHTDLHFTATDVGLSGDVWVYDWKNKTGQKLSAGQSFSGSFGSSASIDSKDPSWAYYIVAPVSKNGIALVGDQGKFASMGRQRIEECQESDDSIQLTLQLAPGESDIVLHGFASVAPVVSAAGVTVDQPKLDGQHFTVSLHPRIGADRVFVVLKRG